MSSSFKNATLTTSPRNSVWFADADGLANLALDVRDRLREHRRAGDRSVEVREPVQRVRREIDVDRLRELADDGAVFAVDDAEAEHSARPRSARA